MEEVDVLADIVFRETIRALPPTSSHSRQDVLQAPIGTSLRCYLTALFDQRERDLLEGFHPEETDWVDDYDGAVQGALTRLHEIVGARLNCPAETWEEVVRHAAGRTVRYVADPRVALATAHAAATTGSDGVRRADLRMGLRFFDAYPKFLKHVASRLDRASGSITGEEYASLIENAVKDAFADYQTADWITEVAPLYDLYRTEAGDPAVPARVLENVLTAFGAHETLTNVQTYAAKARLTALSAEQFERACFGRDDFAEETEVTPEKQAMPADVGSAADHVPAEAVNATSTATGPVPLWRQFQTKLNAPIRADETPPNTLSGSNDRVATATKAGVAEQPSEPEPAQAEKKSGDVATDQPEPASRLEATQPTESDLKEEPSTQPIWSRYKPRRHSGTDISIDVEDAESVLFRRLDGATHDRYVKSLFNGSEQAYRTVLSRIATAPDWAEASAIIARDVFRRYRINIYSDVAVSFTNAVEQHFRASNAPSS